MRKVITCRKPSRPTKNGCPATVRLVSFSRSRIRACSLCLLDLCLTSGAFKSGKSSTDVNGHHREPCEKISYGLEASLRRMVNLIFEFQGQVDELKNRKGEAAAIPEVELIESISGIGSKLTSSIVAELGDASQFTNP
jgi:hypothetical protein